jgi:hypothetical protein
MTGRLLRAAGTTVTAVTVTDLGPDVRATRIDLAAPGGTGQVTTRLADGLAVAVITGAPLAVEDPVMGRLAEPVTDVVSPFGRREQEPSGPPLRPRFEPRNLTFADGLHRWRIDGTFLRQGTGFDYSCAAEDGRAILTATRPEPVGFAFLNQEIFAEDYRGRTVIFSGELRAAGVVGRAGLVLRVTSQGRNTADPDPRRDPASHFAYVTGTGTGDWTGHEVTAQVPPGTDRIAFGVFLNGPGQVELRRPQLQADG